MKDLENENYALKYQESQSFEINEKLKAENFHLMDKYNFRLFFQDNFGIVYCMSNFSFLILSIKSLLVFFFLWHH